MQELPLPQLFALATRAACSEATVNGAVVLFRRGVRGWKVFGKLQDQCGFLDQ